MKEKATSSLKLPFLFDRKELLTDLQKIIQDKWVPHFNKNGYKGSWSSIPLYAENGDETNIFALNKKAIQETPILKNCFYFKKVLQHFKCPLLSVRLLKLDVGAKIKPHRDYELGYENNTFRLHIPIITNANVEFILDNELLVMLPGECWYTNVNYIHSVENKGTTNRVHLVIDGERNSWSDKLFFSLASKESLLYKQKENMSRSKVLQIIDELQHRNEPAAKQLIASLKKQLINT